MATPIANMKLFCRVFGILETSGESLEMKPWAKAALQWCIRTHGAPFVDALEAASHRGLSPLDFICRCHELSQYLSWEDFLFAEQTAAAAKRRVMI